MHYLKKFHLHRRLYRPDLSPAGDCGCSQCLPEGRGAVCQQHAENGQSHAYDSHLHLKHVSQSHMLSGGYCVWFAELERCRGSVRSGLDRAV